MSQKKLIKLGGIGFFVFLILSYITKFLGSFFAIHLQNSFTFDDPLNKYVNFLVTKIEATIIHPRDRVLSEINPFMNINKVKNFDVKHIDIELSKNDIQMYNTTLESAKKLGYMAKDINPRRKVEVDIDNKLYTANMKFHGQSTGSTKKRAYSVKFKKENFYNTKKRIKFILFEQAQGINSLFAYDLGEYMGLIKNEYEVAVLHINGIVQGAYFAEEHIDEYLLEKNGIADGVMVKIHDEFNANSNTLHNSRYHSIPGGIEVSHDDPKIVSLVTQQFDLFMKGVKEQDIDGIKRFLDLDYLARYEAVRLLLKDNHSIRGNNIKFYYRTSNGKFYPIHRIEGEINTYARLNDLHFYRQNSSPEYLSYYHYNTDGMQPSAFIPLINSDTEFRKMKYQYLGDMLNNKVEILNKYKDLLEKYADVISYDITNNYGTRYYKRILKKGKIFIENNISQLSSFLSFSRLYVYTKISEDHLEISFSPDSVAAIKLDNLILHFSGSYQQELSPVQVVFPNGDIKEFSLTYSGNSINLNDVFKDESRMLAMDTEQNYQEYTAHYSFALPSELLHNFSILDVSAYNTFSKEKILSNKIITNYTRIEADKTYVPKDIEEFILKNKQISLIQDEQDIYILSGIHYLSENTIFPIGYRVHSGPDTTFVLGSGVSFLSYSPFVFSGSTQEPITITSASNTTFGSFGHIGQRKETVYLNNVIVENGSEGIVNGVKMLGGLSLYHTNVTIENIIIRNNKADDGLNIKNARVSINNSSFINNAADQFDCDYCIGSIKNSEFYVNMKNPDGDGLDVSGSDLTIQGNNFTGFGDKGISIGEKTYVFIEENTFIDNNLGMAIKDASQAYVGENIFNDNKLDIVLYQKKEIFGGAGMHSTQQILNNLEIELDKRSSKIYYDTRESLSLAYKSHGTGE